MEERKLRRHLIRIYVTTVAAILAALLILVLFFSAREVEQKNRDSFKTLMTAIGDELQGGNIVSHTRLSQLEQENNLSISVGDNGKTLAYHTDDEARNTLIARAEQAAREAGYDVRSLPLSLERRSSPVSEFYEGGARYLSGVSILPMQQGYRTLTLVQRQQGTGALRLLPLLAAYLLGVLLLGGVGVRLIDRALQPAVESRKRQTQFIAAASHELRSPLAVIGANLAVLPQDARESAAGIVIAKECGRMSRLVGDLLLLASADAGVWSVSMELLDVDTLLLDVYEAYAPLYQKSGASLRLNLPEECLPKIKCDAGRLREVLGILLENALAYGVSQQDGAVELEAVRAGKRVSLRVADHGPGLTREQKTRVFERFYRADDSRKDKQHFGLGLSVAAELVRCVGGTIEVRDTPGGGCTFLVTFEC
jgi:signal transduction histidine kinase